MKKEILKVSIVLSLLGFVACEGGSNNSSNENNTNTQESNRNDPNRETELSPIFESNSTVSLSMKVGVDYEFCQQIQLPQSLTYVSTTGNDEGADGTEALPYRTIAKAVKNAQIGETIVIHGGTYIETEEIRIRASQVTLSSYPNEWAIIDRSSDTYEGSDGVGIYLDVDSDGSKVQCLEVKGGYYAISTETKWDWGEEDRMGATKIQILNVKAHDSYADVVKIKPNSDDFDIRYSELYNSGIGQNREDCNAEGIDNVNGDGMYASHLYVHDICSNGIYVKGGAKQSVIEYSLIERTGSGGIMLGFDTSPEYFDTSNVQMYESISAKAHHNVVKDAKGSGIGLYASKDSEVYNNTIIDSSTRYHAPIYFGITFQDWEANANRPANINPSIHHNIIAQESVQNIPMVDIRYSNELGGLSALEGSLNMDNNCYFQTTLISPVVGMFFEDGRERVGEDENAWHGNFETWKIHIDSDYHSYKVNPLFDEHHIPQAEECRLMGYKVEA